MFHIGSPEKFPTQTPTVNRFEYPIHQLSLMSLLVPVFTAVQKRVASGLSRLNVRLRLSRSESMSDTMKAASLESALRWFAPWPLSNISRSSLQTPPLARQR